MDTIETKVCSHCKIEKEKLLFDKRPSRPCGVVARCKACHYTNLQPMWAIDNYSKGSKVA